MFACDGGMQVRGPSLPFPLLLLLPLSLAPSDDYRKKERKGEEGKRGLPREHIGPGEKGEEREGDKGEN